METVTPVDNETVILIPASELQPTGIVIDVSELTDITPVKRKPIVIDSRDLSPSLDTLQPLRSHKSMAEQTPDERTAYQPKTLLQKAKKIAREVKEAVVPVPGMIAAGYADAVGATNQWIGENIVQPVVNLVDSDPTHTSNALTEAGKGLRQGAAAAQQGAQLEHPVEPHSLGANVRSALVSTGQQLPYMVAAIPTAPLVGVQAAARIPLTAMAMQSGAQSYGELRDAGVSPLPATVGGLATGLIEYATEKIPAEKFLEAVKRPLAKTLGQMAIGEIGGEEIATVTQDMIRKGYLKTDPVTGQVSPNRTGKEMVDSINSYFQSGEAAQNMKDTFWSTLIQTGVMGGAAKVSNKVFAPRVQPVPAAQATQPNPDDPFNQVAVEPKGPLSRAVGLANPPAVVNTIRVTPEGQGVTPAQYSPMETVAAMTPEAIAAAREKLAAPSTTAPEATATVSPSAVSEVPSVRPEQKPPGFAIPLAADSGAVVMSALHQEPASAVTSWAREQINKGNTPLMRQYGENQKEYGARLAAEYEKKNATQPEPSREDQVLASIDETDRENLKAVQEAAQFWEKGSWTNGRSNKTELMPWLKDWGKTTPAEVAQAIDNHLSGKKLGDVQKRLVVAAIEHERDRQPVADTSFDFSGREAPAPQAIQPEGMQIFQSWHDANIDKLSSAERDAEVERFAYSLTGIKNAGKRAEIISALTGQTTPKISAGVRKVYDAVSSWLATDAKATEQSISIPAPAPEMPLQVKYESLHAQPAPEASIERIAPRFPGLQRPNLEAGPYPRIMLPANEQRLEKRNEMQDALPHVTDDNNTAMQHLVDIGATVYENGMDYPTFAKGMKENLGDSWSKFKGLMLKVYREVKTINKRLGERGSIEVTPIAEAIRNVDLKRLGQILNPVDFSRTHLWIEDRRTQGGFIDALSWFFANPFFQAERDPNKKPFVMTGEEREVNRMQTILDMFGWDSTAKSEQKSLAARARDFFFSWRSGDTVTQWENLKQEFYDLTPEQQKAFDLIFVEGDAYGREYKTLETALVNTRLKGANLDQPTFDLYKKVREHIDVTANDAKIKALRKFLEDSGVSEPEILKHIEDYRKHFAERTGWLTRDHGEGDIGVNVYHVIKSLDFDRDVVKDKKTENDLHRVRLAYYPGAEVIKQMEKVTEKLQGKFRLTPNGQAIMLFPSEELADEAVRAMDEIPLEIDGEPMRVKVYAQYVYTNTQARKLAAEVKSDYAAAMPHNYREGQEYVTPLPQPVDKLTESVYQNMPSDMALEAALEQAAKRALNRGEMTKEEYAEVKEQWIRNTAETLLGRAAGRYQIRRAEYLIEGYQTDGVNDLFESYMTGVAGMLSKAAYAREQFEHYRKARPEVKTWAANYITDSLRNMGRADRLSGNIRALLSLWYLGLKPASVLVNMTQVWTLGYAELGRFTKDPAKILAKAQKDIFTGNLSQEEEESFHTAIYHNQEQATAMSELTGHSQGLTDRWSKVLHKVTGKALGLFQKGEILNRKTMILAGYRVNRAQGMSSQKALKKAVELDSTVNFAMGRHNLPGFARTAPGRTVYALQSFTWNTMNYIYNRATSGEKDQMIALLRLAASFALFGGAMAMPGGDEMDKIFRMLTGRSYKLDLQQWTRKHAKGYGSVGEMLDAFIWHGLPSLAGVNISNSIRFQFPVLSPLLAGDSLPEAVSGVAGGLVQKGINAGKALRKGNLYRAGENIAPEIIAGGMRAYRQATEGATTLGGKPVFDEHGRKLRYSGLDAAKRVLGFQPLKQSRRMEIAQEEKAIREQWNGERQDLLDQLRNADTGNRGQVRRRIMKWNRELRQSQAKGIVIPITADTMHRSLNAKPNKKSREWGQNYLD